MNTYVFYLAFTTTYRTFRYDCGFSMLRALRFAYAIAKQGLVINGMTRVAQLTHYADERVNIDRAAGKVMEIAF